MKAVHDGPKTQLGVAYDFSFRARFQLLAIDPCSIARSRITDKPTPMPPSEKCLKPRNTDVINRYVVSIGSAQGNEVDKWRAQLLCQGNDLRGDVSGKARSSEKWGRAGLRKFRDATARAKRQSARRVISTIAHQSCLSNRRAEGVPAETTQLVVAFPQIHYPTVYHLHGAVVDGTLHPTGRQVLRPGSEALSQGATR